MIIIGVDPGKITGLALYQSLTSDAIGSGTVIGPIKSWAVAEVTNTQVIPYIRALLRGRKPDAIACERFVQGTGRRSMSYQGDAQHITGEVSALAQDLGCPFIRQLAGPAKKTGNDKILKQLGCYTVTPGGHANDGCRQVVRAMATLFPDFYAQLIGL